MKHTVLAWWDWQVIEHLSWFYVMLLMCFMFFFPFILFLAFLLVSFFSSCTFVVSSRVQIFSWHWSNCAFIWVVASLTFLNYYSFFHKQFYSFFFLATFVQALDLFLYCLILVYYSVFVSSLWHVRSHDFGLESALGSAPFKLIVLFAFILLGFLLLRKCIQLFILSLSIDCHSAFIGRSHYAFRQIAFCSFQFRFECAFLHLFFFKNLLGLLTPFIFVACSS